MSVQLQYNNLTQRIYGTVRSKEEYEVRTGLIWSSIVPKPSHRPVFDCFQYVKLEANKNGQWEGLGMRLVFGACNRSQVLAQASLSNL